MQWSEADGPTVEPQGLESVAVPVAPGLIASVPARVRFPPIDIAGRRFGIVVGLQRSGEGIDATSVEVCALDDRQVTSTDLRAIKMHELTQLAVRQVVEFVESGDGHVDVLDAPDAEAIRTAGPTVDSLRWVARYYNLAELLKLRPTLMVEQRLGLPHSTAANWVRRARDAGLIRDTVNGER